MLLRDRQLATCLSTQRMCIFSKVFNWKSEGKYNTIKYVRNVAMMANTLSIRLETLDLLKNLLYNVSFKANNYWIPICK